VREAAIVALPDAYAGERPLAYVALWPGQEVTADAIIAHVAAQLAKFKVPVRVEFRDDLPKLPTGKVLRRLLRDEARTLPPAPRPRSIGVSGRADNARRARPLDGWIVV